MSTNVPNIAWIEGAPVIPTAEDLLSGRWADQLAALGPDLNPLLETPQGQLRQSEVAIIEAKNAEVAYVSNMLDPTKAEGVWQDAIGKLYKLTRIAGAGTVVNCVCTGLPGTVIPAGSQAQDVNGALYALVADATIGAGGTVEAQFQNTTPGPIACPVGAVSRIYSAVVGWDSVSNPAAGALGNLVEGRYAFEERRFDSVMIGSAHSPMSKLAALRAVPGVIDAYYAENDTAAPITVGATDFPLPANSICYSVAGGSAQAVALALLSRKVPGCQFVGDTEAVVNDTTNYDSPPYPQYTVKWLTPASVPIYARVGILSNDTLPVNIDELIRAAFVSAFNGGDGGARARIGRPVYAGRYYEPVNLSYAGVRVVGITLGLTPSTAVANFLDFGIDQMPVISPENIVVLRV